MEKSIRNVVNMYWDVIESDFIGDEAVAYARIQNSVSHVQSYSDWYVEFLSGTLRPAIVEAIAAIEAYQVR
jgi:hypothetical protein